MKMIEHNHFICHLILGTFTEYPFFNYRTKSRRFFTSKFQSIRFLLLQFYFETASFYFSLQTTTFSHWRLFLQQTFAQETNRIPDRQETDQQYGYKYYYNIRSMNAYRISIDHKAPRIA